jgi:putative transposase
MHIVQRATDRNACFRSDPDRSTYLAILGFVAREEACRIHAYCLMTNHVHLLVTPADAEGCSALMKRLSQRYSYYFNRKHGRTGHLWESRFRSSLVLSAEYVLACHRYIELNPVRAGMATDPGAYAWSSCAGNIGTRADGLVAPHPDVLALGPGTYAALLREPREDHIFREIRMATRSGQPLSSVSDNCLTPIFSGGGVS